jgi:hypothetical protein
MRIGDAANVVGERANAALCGVLPGRDSDGRFDFPVALGCGRRYIGVSPFPVS